MGQVEGLRLEIGTNGPIKMWMTYCNGNMLSITITYLIRRQFIVVTFTGSIYNVRIYNQRYSGVKRSQTQRCL